VEEKGILRVLVSHFCEYDARKTASVSLGPLAQGQKAKLHAMVLVIVNSDLST
jgi:hypothetical protein